MKSKTKIHFYFHFRFCFCFFFVFYFFFCFCFSFFFSLFFFFFCNFLVIFWYIIVKKCHFRTQNAKNSDCFWIENFISYNIKRNNFSDIEGPMNFVFKLHNLLTPVLNIVIFLSIFVSSFLKHVLKIRVKVNNHT